MFRPDYVEQLTGFDGNYISADRRVFKIYGLYIFLESFVVLEYFTRHIYKINSLIIYNAYPYIIQAVSTYVLWVVLRYAQQALIKRSIKA
jgi:hypothetical protein